MIELTYDERMLLRSLVGTMAHGKLKEQLVGANVNDGPRAMLQSYFERAEGVAKALLMKLDGTERCRACDGLGVVNPIDPAYGVGARVRCEACAGVGSAPQQLRWAPGQPCVHLQREELDEVAALALDQLPDAALMDHAGVQMRLCPLCYGFVRGMLHRIATEGLP